MTRSLSPTPRGKLCLALLACALLLLFLHRPSSPPHPPLPRPLVVLSSTPARLRTSLPPTLWSLATHQSLPPSAIHVYLPRTGLSDERQEGRHATDLAATEDPIFSHPLVQIKYVDDEGPATKFLPALRTAFEQASTTGDFSSLSKPIVVVDDDHVYSPRLVETLVRRWVALGGDAAVGLRGWRVREDLKWGVGGEDLARHVVEGCTIRSEYRVGVLTANEGYIVTPSMFLSPATRAALLHSPSTFNLSLLSPSAIPLFSPPPDAPESLHLVDDILLSGSLASTSTPRFVVPLPPPTPPSVDITPRRRPPAERAGEAGRSPVEEHLAAHGKSRNEANDEALEWFGEAWKKEGIWYDMRTSEERRDRRGDEPEWAGTGSRFLSEVAKWGWYRRAKAKWGEQVRWH